MTHRVLVVAPRFPAINQPWIDTYLEQLLAQGFDVAIWSANRSHGSYQEKVDALQLRERIVALPRRFVYLLVLALATGCRHPHRALGCLRRARELVSRFGDVGLNRGVAMLKLFSFGMVAPRFGTLDLCHGHEEIASWQALHLALMLDIPMVLSFHGLPPPAVAHLATPKRQMLFRQASRILVNSQFARRQLLDLGAPADRIAVLPQGLPLDEFPSACVRRDDSDSPLRLLTVARFSSEKGYAYCLLAARRLRDAGVDFRYTLVGVGPLRSRLELCIQKLGLQRQVQLKVALPTAELRALYRGTDIFILASIGSRRSDHVETQGVVLQEAQASGCIVVATRVGGIPESINHEADGILIRERSSRAIAAAVLELTQQRERWPALRAAGRKNVEQRFAASLIGEKMAALLRTLIEQRARPAGAAPPGLE